jgi:hypothetical protein
LISVCLSENGVINSELTLLWMQAFDEATKPLLEDKTEWQQLVIDSHRSHLQKNFVDYADAHRIDVTGYVPHATHELQGLDKVCFAPFKNKLGKMRDHHRRKTGHGMSKKSFMAKLRTAFDITFTKPICITAFRCTGVYPVNRHVISSDVVAPSETQSIEATFGIPQPEEIRMLLPLLELVRENDGILETELGQSTFALHTTSSAPTALVSPSLFVIDPILLTPHTRKMVEAAKLEIEKSNSRVPPPPRRSQSTTSDSDSDSDSDSPTPEIYHTPVIPCIQRTPPSLHAALMGPDHEPESLEEAKLQLKELREAQDRYQAQMKEVKVAGDRKNAMIILQNLRLRSQNRKLNFLGKQKSKKKDRAVRLLASKHGRALLGPVFRAAVHLDAAERALKERMKDKAQAKRQLAKQQREWVEKEKQERKEKQAEDLQRWEEEKEEAEADDKPIPPRPRVPKKADPPEYLIWKTPEPSDDEMDEEDEDVAERDGPDSEQ